MQSTPSSSKPVFSEQLKDKLAVMLMCWIGNRSLNSAQRLGVFIAKWIWRLHLPMRRIAQINVDTCFPNWTPESRQQLVRRNLMEMCKTFCEACVLWRQAPQVSEAAITSVKGSELLESALAEGKGLILLAPHIGNWELIPSYIQKHASMTAIYMPARLEGVDQLIHGARSRFETNIVPASKRGVAAVLKALRRGGVVGILPDQVASGAASRLAPFFGELAQTQALSVRLIQQTGAQALCAYCKRMQDGTFELVFAEADAAIYDDDLDIALGGLNRSVERCIVEIPDQYQWSYRRFRKRGPDLPNLYR